MNRDVYTNTPDDAGAFDRAHAYEDYDDGRPSPSDLAEMAADDARRPAGELSEVDRFNADLIISGGLFLPPGAQLVPTNGTAVVVTDAPAAFNDRVVAWAEARPDLDVMLRDDVVYLRRNGRVHPLHNPPF